MCTCMMRSANVGRRGGREHGTDEDNVAFVGIICRNSMYDSSVCFMPMHPIYEPNR